MASVIERLQRRTATPDEEARILEITDGDADEVLDTLAAETRRRILQSLFQEPATPSELAERIDTSVQNAHYHLTDLQEAGLIEPIDTVYSPKGNEMTVYGPANDPIVFVGDADSVSRIRQSLSEVLAGLGLLAAASLLVQWGAERLLRGNPEAVGGLGPTSATPSEPTQPGSVVWLLFEVLEPGVVFFTGCLLVAGVAALLARR